MAETVKGIELWARLRAEWSERPARGRAEGEEERSGEKAHRRGCVQGGRSEGEAEEHGPLEPGGRKGQRAEPRG